MNPRQRDVLKPWDTHEVRVVAVLTAAWIVALAVLLFLRDSLPPDQRWWIWTCVAGTGGGVIALGYLYQRRRSLEKRDRR